MQTISTQLSMLLAVTLIAGCGKKTPHEKNKEELLPKTEETLAVKKKTSATDNDRAKLAGRWHGVITLDGDDMEVQFVPFDFNIGASATDPSVVMSGNSEVPITSISVNEDEVTMEFVSYQTKIVADLTENFGVMKGTWILPWAGDSLEFPFSAARLVEGQQSAEVADNSASLGEAAIAAVPSVSGLWEVSFSQPDGSKKLCGARFAQDGSTVQGAVVAPTGDYGHLAGVFEQGKLRLSNFDGAFAYVVAADAQADGTLIGAGQFNLFRQEFTARHIGDRGLDAKLPECAEITEWSGKGSPLSLKFTDLSGKGFSLADAGLKGKVVLLDFFGTWCPNCHELVPLLKEWHEKYHSAGLEIIGVSFEFANGQASVSAYRDRHKIPYRLLVGAAPQDAGDVLPQMPLTSFPTVMLVGRDGKIHNIQTGFRGPATGDFRKADAARFEDRIKKLLAMDAK